MAMGKYSFRCNESIGDKREVKLLYCQILVERGRRCKEVVRASFGYLYADVLSVMVRSYCMYQNKPL